MSATGQTTSAETSGHSWIANQPYVLLSITALCWAGNAIVGRLAAGHIPPVTLSFLRWFFAFLLVLPFAWKHLVQDWPAIRARTTSLSQPASLHALARASGWAAYQRRTSSGIFSAVTGETTNYRSLL